MTKPTIHFQPTAYEVNCLPDTDINAYLYAVQFTRNRRGEWSVEQNGDCLGGGRPHMREATCHIEHRYTLEDAYAIATRAAPEVIVMGRTVADALARSQAEEPDPT